MALRRAGIRGAKKTHFVSWRQSTFDSLAQDYALQNSIDYYLDKVVDVSALYRLRFRRVRRPAETRARPRVLVTVDHRNAVRAAVRTRPRARR
jgi:hypothetical protein